MSKLNQEELLAKLDEWFGTVYDYGEKSDHLAYEQIKELIQKPAVTEEWIEEKAKELSNKIHLKGSACNYVKDFIRSLIEEMK